MDRDQGEEDRKEEQNNAAWKWARREKRAEEK